MLEGDLLDLEPQLRDAVVLALPFTPLCEDDCPGLCVECGARLADDPDHQHEEPIDPRWAARAPYWPQSGHARWGRCLAPQAGLAQVTRDGATAFHCERR